MPTTAPYTNKILKKLKEHKFKGNNLIGKKCQNGNVILFRTEENRETIINEISKVLNKEKIEIHHNRIIFKNHLLTKIDVKGKSPGIQNEKNFSDLINQIIKENLNEGINEGISIKFVETSQNKESITFNNVIKAINVGNRSSGRKKADVALMTSDGKSIPISLKQENSEEWESADTLLGDIAREKLKDTLKTHPSYYLCEINDIKNKIKDVEKDVEKTRKYKLSKGMAFSLCDEMIEDVCFGSDIIQNNGCIITNTFPKFGSYTTELDNDHFVFSIKVKKFYNTLQKIKNDDDVCPYLLIRNDSNRVCKKLGIPGIRCLAVYKKRVKNIIIK